MEVITVAIEGPPIPLKRPRFSPIKVFDSQAKIKEEIFWEIKSQLDYTRSPYIALFEGLVKAEFEFHMPIPKSLSKKKQAKLLGKYHTKRPDIDNLIKFYLDVCNALLYKDDSQVYTLSATKKYSLQPKTIIKITHGE